MNTIKSNNLAQSRWVIILLILVSINVFSADSDHFVITVDTSISGSSGLNSFIIPTTGSGYNYSIDSNNNGTFDITGRTENTQINYASGGIKTIRIVGDFPRIFFNESGDKDKILAVQQWGTIQWASMNNAFSGASNLVINASDTPDLSLATSLFKMFLGASNLGNGNGNWNWDTSTILGMSQLFKDAVAFDKDISSWNVENVNNFGAMFTGAKLSSHNYDALLISWISQNLNSNMVFNGGNSLYCSQAALNARANLINIDGWTISDGGYESTCFGIDDMENHFVITVNTENTGTSGANSFTIPTNSLFTYNYNVDWNNDGVFDASGRDEDTTINYGGPGIKTIRIFGEFPAIYFINAGDKDKIISIDQWGSNRWTNMGGAFSGASNLVNNALDVPDLAMCFNLNSVFKNAESIGQGTANWNWDTSNVVSLQSAFNGATSFNADISSWNIESLTSTSSLFAGVTLSPANYDALLIGWESQNVNSSLVFSGGFSLYCSQAAQDARQRLIDNDGWSITDGGFDVSCVPEEVIFMNGFEDVVTIKTSLEQITYDFSKTKVTDFLNDNPKLIISGLDSYAKENMQIYIRNDMGILQIRIDFKINKEWQLGQWQNINNQVLTTLHWEK